MRQAVFKIVLCQSKDSDNINLIEDLKEIEVQSSIPLESFQTEIIGEFANELQLEFQKNLREKNTTKEKKLERKKARLMKSKQALSQFKKGVLYIVIAIHYFLKNPENIAKCFVIGVSCFFMSSFMSIPDMGNRHPLYLLDWLAYNRSSRTVLVSGSLCIVSFEWYLIYLMWIFCVGFNNEADSRKFRTLLNDCNPLLSLSLVFMTDNDLINNKFDLAVWFCNIFFYSTTRVYFLSSQNMIKKTLSNLTPENLSKVFNKYRKNQISLMNQLNQFSTIIIVVNLIYTITGILMFRKVGFYALSLLFYGGISTLVEYVKIFLMTKSLQNNYHYYINNNIDVLNEPFFVFLFNITESQELIADALFHILKVIYCLQLIANYFRTVSLQFVLHLWLFYLLSDLQNSLSCLKKAYDLHKRQTKIQSNLDTLFPRTDPSNLQPDEICTICHDELLCSRTLQCGHKFHLKCLFNWLKNQQHCPMCRQQIDNVDLYGGQPGSMLGRIIQMLTNITLFNITIYFQPGRNNEQQNGLVPEAMPQPQEFEQQLQPQLVQVEHIEDIEDNEDVEDVEYLEGIEDAEDESVSSNYWQQEEQRSNEDPQDQFITEQNVADLFS